MSLYERTLQCGARFIGYNGPEVHKNVALAIAIPRGAVHDPPEIKGAHHFLEHLLFKSHTDNERVALARSIERKGGSLNADTSYFQTKVYVNVNPKYVGEGISFLTLLAGKPPEFTSYAFGIERKVVYEEQGLYHDDPECVINEASQAALYARPFGGNVLGSHVSLSRMSTTNLLEIWQQGYLPKNFVICAVGPVEMRALSDNFERALERNILNGRGKELSPTPPIKKRQPRDYILIRDNLEQCHLGFAMHAPIANTRESFAFSFLDNFLTGGFFSELYQEIREKRGLTYGISSLYCWGRDYGDYTIELGTNPKNAAEVIDLIRAGFASAEQMDSREFAENRRMILGRIENEEETNLDLALELLEREEDGLGSGSYFRRKERIAQVTLDEVRAVAKLNGHCVVAISPKHIRGFKK